MSSSPTHPLDAGTRLAVERTRLAHERTLMAWVRTAASLISFGFTIYKFFEFEAAKGSHGSSPLLTPRQFGMIMIGTGLVALFLSTIEHRQSLKRLHLEFAETRRSVAAVVAGVVVIMGVLAFVAAALRG
jgi:putative membrane protein